MGKGSSSSSTSQATTSTTTDIAAQSSGIAVGGDYTNDFGPGAQSVIQSVIDFSGNVLSGAQQILSQSEAASQQASANSLNSAENIAANATNNAQLGQTSIFTNPGVLTAIVTSIGLIGFMVFMKK